MKQQKTPRQRCHLLRRLSAWLLNSSGSARKTSERVPPPPTFNPLRPPHEKMFQTDDEGTTAVTRPDLVSLLGKKEFLFPGNETKEAKNQTDLCK